LSDGQSFVTAECSGPEATLTHYGGPDFKTSTRRYAMNRGEVLNEWSGVAAYNVAVFPEQEFALDYSAGLGGSGGHISYSFRMLDFRAGTIQILDFPDGAGLLYANRLYLMRASADGARFLRSWAHITNTAMNNGPHGSITVHSVTVTKDRTVKDKEIGRYAGNTACFDPTGKRILTGKDKTLSLWNEDTGVAVGKFSFPGEGSVLCVAVSPNGEFFAAGTDKNEVHIWSKADQKLIATAKGHTDKVNGVDFTQDSKRVVSASQDSSVRVWNAADGTEAGKFKHEGPVYSLAITPGGKRLLSGGQDKRIRLWQLPE